jgi:hypothetical protein
METDSWAIFARHMELRRNAPRLHCALCGMPLDTYWPVVDRKGRYVCNVKSACQRRRRADKQQRRQQEETR